MYYVLYETKNKKFFLHIADEFCKLYVQSIIAFYKSKAVSQQNSIMVDMNLVKETLLTKQKKATDVLNCTLFPTVHCENQGCYEEHRAVLASDQLAIFVERMTKIKTAFIAVGTRSDTRDHINLQYIFQNIIPSVDKSVERISIPPTPNHDAYLRSYVDETNKLGSKPNPKAFVYVRAETDSDYNDFVAKTSLPGVTPCDYLQAV